ncbi:hypothetical protein [Adhaeribacter aquaticus]|uniref:hypothetical protein n=1 Tax=Adhaeribacter aquaticus TaxID=299567 RepID=UPI0004123922|nr:hypothetical protein [Adhaeribacter aquaticus]
MNKEDLDNQGLKENNSPNPSKSKEKRSDRPENVFDDDNSLGKDALGENPEQILYNNGENVEDAKDIISDANNE